ncbi:hypothetical protein JYU34_020824 [Plutella xylostella]|uniref:ubiquitinyl hydrolase 1 n=1 Tax=Plutella xylostella TaxID=51655 RepID=A0ABQ7PS21_PLUXY|nr:hypothetical protein JYU34_020824 [Plutella xylostella]
MDLMKTDYEFLDLSDVKEADLSSLHSALFKLNPKGLEAAGKVQWPETAIDIPGGLVRARAVSGSVDGGDEMPPSPPRAAPPPPYAPPYPPQQWPVAPPPNVYVSQVTANVNVHGYMGQYYQPQQYGDRGPRQHRRGRGKRAPSPPPPPPYYVQYPHYYPPAPAQGAPLYHLPVYQPVVYPSYPYYYPEYPMPVEGEEKPEEYPPEVVMEQEAVDAYYANAHYAGPPYAPPVDGPMEYMPPMYHMPPPAHPPPPHHAPHPPHHTPHQFNVHAKNFVLPNHKPYSPPDKSQEQKPASVSAAVAVETLVKDMKISPASASPKHSPTPPEPKPPTPVDKAPPVKVEPKTAWTPTEQKPAEAVVTQAPPSAKSFPPIPTTAASKMAPPVSKVTTKTPAPFSGAKQPPKPAAPPAAVPVQPASTPKPPFGNRQKREGPPHRSPSADGAEPPPEHVKREPPLPPSKAPMPISITLHSGQGAPVIVTNKSPFSRKPAPVVEAAPAPPPPAPTASDFPPPPTPRHRGEPAPPAPAPVAPPAPGKSWASLFNKSSSISTAPAPVPVAPVPVEEPSSPTAVIPPVNPKPVAKVPPFDASPLQQNVVAVTEKVAPAAVKPAPVTAAPSVLSYSEKTSVGASGAAAGVSKPASPAGPEPREVPVVKDAAPALPVQPSPFADDPNSYRMGEFLSKYTLDNRPVSLLPRGLTNRSNYCYVNAILQALIACPPFYNMLKALPYQTRRGKSSTPVIDAMVELCYEFTPLPPNARVSRARGAEAAGALPVQTGPPLDPAAGQKVLRALRPFPGSQEGRQEDAEEFLGCLLNGLNDEMLELMKLVEPEGEAQNGVAQDSPPEDEDDDDDEWKVMGPKNKGAVERRWAAGRTPLADIFRGRTRCRLHRVAHHDVTDAVQPFFTLQLDIERANSVKDALELVAGKDTLEGVSDAWQQLSIEQLPIVLLLHLKCFQLDAEGHTAKIVKNIDFPIDLKIDQKIMSSKLKYAQKQRQYKLFAVVYHEGVEAVKGHYLTDTYHGQAGWIRYDDSTVTLVNDAQVLKPKAPRMPYLLMYRRQDTLPVPHRAAPKPE